MIETEHVEEGNPQNKNVQKAKPKTEAGRQQAAPHSTEGSRVLEIFLVTALAPTTTPSNGDRI